MLHLALSTLLILLALPVAAAPLDCSGPQQTTATYVATSGAHLEACFDQQRSKVTLRLPDATLVSLPRAVSGSGARYSDAHKTFWEHQGTGRYFVGEKLLFEGKPAAASGYKQGVSAKVLIKTGVTANGGKIVYPVTDSAEVTALTVDLAPGAETGWHKHTIPVYGYVLSGSLEVELEGGKRFAYTAGDAIIEVVDTFHNGRNNGDMPVKLLVFYLGIKGQPAVTRK